MTSSPIPSRGAPTLLPCPFCGREDSTDNPMQESAIRVRQFNSPAGGRACRVECCCGVQGVSHREDWAAISSWNARALFPVEAANGSGWKMVPVEPTDAMVEAYFAAHARSPMVMATAEDAHAAMIAASPPLAEGQDGKGGAV